MSIKWMNPLPYLSGILSALVATLRAPGGMYLNSGSQGECWEITLPTPRTCIVIRWKLMTSRKIQPPSGCQGPLPGADSIVIQDNEDENQQWSRGTGSQEAARLDLTPSEPGVTELPGLLRKNHPSLRMKAGDSQGRCLGDYRWLVPGKDETEKLWAKVLRQDNSHRPWGMMPPWHLAYHLPISQQRPPGWEPTVPSAPLLKQCVHS